MFGTHTSPYPASSPTVSAWYLVLGGTHTKVLVPGEEEVIIWHPETSHTEMLIPETCYVPTVIPGEQKIQLQKRSGTLEAHVKGEDRMHSFRGRGWVKSWHLVSISGQWDSKAYRRPHQQTLMTLGLSALGVFGHCHLPGPE